MPIYCNLEKNLFWFCHILFLINFTRIKRHYCNKIDTLYHKKLLFHLGQRFPTYLSILKCVQKCLKWFLKYSKCIHASCEHFITRSQCPTQKYEQNKRTTDADYKYISTIRRRKDELKNCKLIKSLEMYSVGYILLY